MVEPESRKAVRPESRFSDESISISYTNVVFLSLRLIDIKAYAVVRTSQRRGLGGELSPT